MTQGFKLWVNDAGLIRRTCDEDGVLVKHKRKPVGIEPNVVQFAGCDEEEFLEGWQGHWFPFIVKGGRRRNDTA